MVNINKGCRSVEEVLDYMRTSASDDYYRNKNNMEVVKVNSEAFNNGTSVDYPYCHNIKHPETGETLTPVKGYMGTHGAGQNREDRCYYAEYRDNQGNSYSYNHYYALYDREGRQMAPEKDIGT